jgi:hypothetical protein
MDRRNCIERFGTAPVRCLRCRRKRRSALGLPEKPPDDASMPDPTAPDGRAWTTAETWENAPRMKK